VIRNSSARSKTSAPPRPKVVYRADAAWVLHPRTEPQPAVEPKPKRGYGRRSYWCALATIVLFAAGFLQFGLLDQLAAPAAERVNNGREATFFALHINPYYVFSEDFHLYAVRAKRILDRGWTDSPLDRRGGEGSNYAAPLQAALGMVAVATDGKPIPYALFIATVIVLAWSGLFVAARRWLPPEMSTRSILAAVLVTVLFESLSGIFNRQLDYAQWPVHRGLRMSTMAWTSPLVLALVLAATSLWFDRKRSRGTIVWIGVLLAALAASDNWALIVGYSTTALVFASLLAYWAYVWQRQETGAHELLTIVGSLAAVLAAVGALHLSLGGALTGDALMRGGVGPAWRVLPPPPGEPAYIEPVQTYFKLLPMLVLIAFVAIRFGRSGAALLPSTNISLARPGKLRMRLVVIAAAPMAALLLMLPVLTIVIGIERYHIFQFIWRVEYGCVFALILAGCELVKLALRRLIPRERIAWRCEVAAIALLVVPLFGYHQYRIYRFVSQTAAREFFLTEDEEQLRDWLRSRPAEQTRTLATASHELNYLCAYWTDADLLLPEGFPYHNASSNAAIEARTAELLRVYAVRPETWTAFNLHGHSDDQWTWCESRLRSAREGYSYYLMHRGMSVGGYDDVYAWARAPLEHPKGTTASMVEQKARAEHGKQLTAELHYGRPLAAIAMVSRVGKLLEEPQPAPRPDVIVVDEVSRALGNPDLAGYQRAFAHGTIEAWVRSDAAGSEAAEAPSQGKTTAIAMKTLPARK
jgi:hypothetical protein